jgi:hypothetical protein
MGFSQQDTTQLPVKHKHRWSPSGFPVIAYDADLGFQYGIVGNLYDYGDWSRYPEYRHAFKLEISRFTKGSGVNQFFYDSKYLIPGNIRVTADLSFLTEKALDYYGYNGYQSIYQEGWEDEESPDYITRMFYRQERKLFRFTCDLQGPILGQKLRWLGGIGIMNFNMGRVDFDAINKGKAGDEKIPDTATLFDHYVDWGIIPTGEVNGGNVNFIKGGLVFDTRDNEPAPMKGLWDEVLLIYSPEFFFNEQSFLKLVVIHRQYFTLVKKKLGLTYRLGYQGTIGGHTPYYFQPYMLSSFSYVTKTDGLGGAKNLRGVLRNRVVGDGVLWGNAEIRWRVIDFVWLKQNFYIGMNGFYDVGMVVQNYDMGGFDRASQPDYFDPDYDYDEAHQSAGLGLRIGWNENFIIAVDYGIPFDGQDGNGGFYVAFGNLW